jgi:hypothetical protein
VASLPEEALKEGTLININACKIADQIFVIVDGTYYYFSLIEDKEEYAHKLNEYKLLSLGMLQFRHQPSF